MQDKINKVIEEYGTIENYIKETEKIKRKSLKYKEKIKYDENLPPKYKLYLKRANKKGIPMTLSINDFEEICKKECVFCGTNLKIGIDRIDSSKGYTIDNTQPACGTCNIMKFTLSTDDFITHIGKIHSFVTNKK
jgi:hypothetical protein